MNKMQSSIQLEDIMLDGGEIISRDGVNGTDDYGALDRGARGFCGNL